MPTLPLTRLEKDIAAGAGRELSSKLRAAHSSSALAINSFGHWKTSPKLFPLCARNFEDVRFEGRCSTGLGGTPPHLDVLATGEQVVGIESKCTEWMKPKTAEFVASYDTLADRWAGRSWFELVAQSRAEPKRYRHLDVAQLVKHALGLMTCYPEKETSLLYIYWEPLNSADWRDCAQHREEIVDLQSRVTDVSVNFRAMSYTELWQLWNPDVLPEGYLSYLRKRYIISA